MAVYSQEATELMSKYREADEAESVAIKALDEYMKAGGGELIRDLSEKIESAHAKKLSIYNEMQKYRLD